MGAATLIPVEEYLRTAYRPDREYIDGRVVERNLGEKSHSKIQRILVQYLSNRAADWGIEVFPEQRVQVRATRFRIPDVTVVRAPEPEDEIFTAPPLLCIEILSKDDTMQDVQDRVDDYLAFGVPCVWIVNPRSRKGYIVTNAGMVEASGSLTSSDPKISVPLSILFDD